MSVRGKAIRTLGLTALALGLTAAPAVAEPILGLQMTRTAAPVTHSDERLAYELTVTNTASKRAALGTELTCQGAGASGSPAPEVEVEWLRNGLPIPGSAGPLAVARTYTVTGEDEGKSLQCLVRGTNDPDGAGAAFAPISSVAVSRPPVAVEPTPSPAPPSGTSAPGLGGPRPAAPSGTATIASGSNVLTEVITAKGTGTLVNGSKVVTEVTTTAGAFTAESLKQTITGTGIATAAFTGDTKVGSEIIKNVAVASGDLMLGQTVTGPGMRQNTTIRKLPPEVPAGTLELSLTASATASGAALEANTVIEAIPGPGTLELSVPATASGSNQALAAGAGPFAVLQKLSGAGIPAGVTITKVVGRSLELSAPATASASEVTVTGVSEETCSAPSGWSGTGIVWSFQWLRNGSPIPGGTSSTYVVQPADTEPPSILQCEAIARDAAGSEAISVSSGELTVPVPPKPYAKPSPSTPTTSFSSKSEGQVTVEAELPLGTQALLVSGAGWSCAKVAPSASQPSSARCSREDSLEPEHSYPPVNLAAQVLHGAPDTLLTKAVASGGGALDSPEAEDTVAGIAPAVPFGFKAFKTEVLDELGDDYTQAGGHPFSAAASLQLTEHVSAERTAEAGFRAVNGFAKVIATDPPPGFVGDPQALGKLCPSIADVVPGSEGGIASTCPAESAIGGIELETEQGKFNLPIFAIEPEYGAPAQFAFGISAFGPLAYTLTPELRPEDGYAISLLTAPIQKRPELYGAKATLCSFGAKLGPQRLGNGETEFKGCREASEPEAFETPFLSLPTRCADPSSSSSTTKISADTWEEPGSFAAKEFTGPALTGCNALDFSPSLEARPTTNAADSPTGLNVDLHIPQNEDPEGTAEAHLKKTVVTLPEGLVVNPSGANGLGACGSAQIGLGTNDPVRCPDSSKVGSVEVDTPILDHPLSGSLYVAAPHDNPFDSLLALYLVVDDPQTGTLVKLAGKVEPNPQTGRLTTTFDENPQFPFEDVKLNIRGGATAPLRTPATCAKYTTTSELTPWSAPESGPPATPEDSYQINRGPNGGPCVTSSAALPNAPAFEAGSSSLIAGAYSPFVVKLRREDGSQQFSSVTLTPPPGLVGKLAGIPYCPEAALAAAAAKSGREEQASPSCPASSQVGTVVAGAGAGPAPYYATGKAYLTGPYKGAPLSLAIVTPATAGPFDLGTIVVRTALQVNPETAQITAISDPIPSILQGIPLDIRSVAISMDRPGFTLNPTSCDPMAVGGQLLSTLGQAAPLSNRFQVAECGRLGFAPKLALSLRGKTQRAGHPALKATLTYPKGAYANVASASVALPHSEFLDQAHIRTICTRVQFAAGQCPAGAIYGHVRATTPLLDQPLEGPVYLRSSSNPLPDLVADLNGQIHVVLDGRVDSVHGGVRTTFAAVPDAPVSKFVLEMQGGAKGLLINSRDICRSTNRATAKFAGQNGKTADSKPVLKAQCGKKKQAHKRHR